LGIELSAHFFVEMGLFEFENSLFSGSAFGSSVQRLRLLFSIRNNWNGRLRYPEFFNSGLWVLSFQLFFFEEMGLFEFENSLFSGPAFGNA
jgi:hypothetical protein